MVLHFCNDSNEMFANLNIHSFDILHTIFNCGCSSKVTVILVRTSTSLKLFKTLDIEEQLTIIPTYITT